ncbi:MAG: hypothetical protein IJE81_07215 [Oscillospiraceae bacterium]|nr:hypothetical protein [Oscillospiraceae bacterium]
MRIPYRTQRIMQRVGIIFLIFLMLFIIAWFCSVIFLERHVVYTREGAMLDMEISANDIIGEVAKPPVGSTNITIFYNEGDDAVDMSGELQQLDGYFIDIEELKNNIAGAWDLLEPLKANTPVMIDLKGGYGSAYYSSTLPGIITSSEVSVASVDELIGYMSEKNFYKIARISALRDYNYGLNHVPAGLMHVNGLGLWPDEGHCYWLDPTKEETINWIISIIKEIKNMGFDEVVLTDFRFPDSDKYRFNGDKPTALAEAAAKLLAACGDNDFTVSFQVPDGTFLLPEGRSRMYLENISATNVGMMVSQTSETITQPELRLVFIAETNDTRFNAYGCLRPIAVSTAMEAQKAAAAAQAKEEARQEASSGRYG